MVVLTGKEQGARWPDGEQLNVVAAGEGCISTTSEPARTRCSARFVPSGSVASDSRLVPEAAASLLPLTFRSSQVRP